ncbi:MAG: methyltransferase domain-containing protein [Candidatus Omnitrophota bacterium]
MSLDTYVADIFKEAATWAVAGSLSAGSGTVRVAGSGAAIERGSTQILGAVGEGVAFGAFPAVWDGRVPTRDEMFGALTPILGFRLAKPVSSAIFKTAFHQRLTVEEKNAMDAVMADKELADGVKVALAKPESYSKDTQASLDQKEYVASETERKASDPESYLNEKVNQNVAVKPVPDSDVKVYDATQGNRIIEDAAVDEAATGGSNRVLQEQAQAVKTIRNAVEDNNAAMVVVEPALLIAKPLLEPESPEPSAKPVKLNTTAPEAKQVKLNTTAPQATTKLDPKSAKTQIAGTVNTYKAVSQNLSGRVLDYGAGLGLGTDALRDAGLTADSYEPFVDRWKGKTPPNYTDASKIPSDSYDSVVSFSVLNVVKPDVRRSIVLDIGRVLKDNGAAFITARNRADVEVAKNKVPAIEDGGFTIGTGEDARYQKGFTQQELEQYIRDTLGDGFTVTRNQSLNGASVKITKQASDMPSAATPQATAPEAKTPTFTSDDGSVIIPTPKELREAFDKIDGALGLLLKGEANGAVAFLFMNNQRLLEDSLVRLAQKGEVRVTDQQAFKKVQDEYVRLQAAKDPYLRYVSQEHETPEQTAYRMERATELGKMRGFYETNTDGTARYVVDRNKAAQMEEIVNNVKADPGDVTGKVDSFIDGVKNDTKDMSVVEVAYIVQNAAYAEGRLGVSPNVNANIAAYSVIMFRKATEKVQIALESLPDVKNMSEEQMAQALSAMMEYNSYVQLFKNIKREWGVTGNTFSSFITEGSNKRDRTGLRKVIVKLQIGTGEEREVRTIDDLIALLKDRDGVLDLAKLQALLQLLKQLDPDSTVLPSLRKPYWGEIIQASLYSWMLMAPTSHVVDFTSMVSVYKAEKLMRHIATVFKGGTDAAEAWSYMKNFQGSDWRDALRGWGKALQNDLEAYPVDAREAIPVSVLMAHSGMKGAKLMRAQESISTNLLIADARFGFILNFQTDARRTAYRQAIAEGKDGIEARTQRANQIYKEMLDYAAHRWKESDKNNTVKPEVLDDITDKSMDFARKNTFELRHGWAYGMAKGITNFFEFFDVGTVNKALGIDPHKVRAPFRWIAQLEGINPLKFLINPFVRTPLQLFARSLDYAPLVGIFSSMMQGDLNAKLLGDKATWSQKEAFRVAMAKQATGILINATLWLTANMLNVDDDDITFEYPADPAVRAMWRTEGKLPYHFRLGGRWYSYQYWFVLLYPMVATLRMRKLLTDPSASDLKKAKPEYQAVRLNTGDLTKEEKTSDSASDKIISFLSYQMQYASDQTFMQGISDWFQAFQAQQSGDPESIKEAWAKLEQSKARLLFPANSLLRWAGQGVQGATEGGIPSYQGGSNSQQVNVLQMALQNTAILTTMMRLGLVPRRSVWGEPIKRENLWFVEWLLPLMSSRGSTDPLTNQLAKWRVNIGMPQHVYDGVTMDRKDQDRYEEQTGKELHEYLTREIMRDPDAWSQANIGADGMDNREKAIREIANDIRRVWREQNGYAKPRRTIPIGTYYINFKKKYGR